MRFQLCSSRQKSITNWNYKKRIFGTNYFSCRGNFLNFDFDLRIGYYLSRVTQKYLFFKNILSFSAPNSPLKFLKKFEKFPKKLLLLTILLITPSIFTRFSSVIPFWKAEGLTIMKLEENFRPISQPMRNKHPNIGDFKGPQLFI